MKIFSHTEKSKKKNQQTSVKVSPLDDILPCVSFVMRSGHLQTLWASP